MAVTINSATVVKANTTVGFQPGSLFAAGEQGVWYDPSDFSTMFQDSAGTTPVTAVEQPVGKILDKSGRGNHATQSTAGSRPTLSARVNLLTKTEQFDDAIWPKDGATVSANTTAAPDGTSTADTLFETAVNNQHLVYQQLTVTNGATYTFKVYLKANQRTYGYIQLADSSSPPKRYSALVNLSTGAITTTRTLNTPVGTASSISSAGSGWYLVTVQMTQSGGTTLYAHVATSNSASPSYSAADFPTYLGDASQGIYVWGADVRSSTDGVGLPVYQRVNTSTDYATTGFPYYLAFNGTSSSLATGNIDFTSSSAMNVFAGIRYTSTATQVFAELTSNYDNISGSFVCFLSTNPQIGWSAKTGTTVFALAGIGPTAGYAPSLTFVFAAQANQSDTLKRILRLNAVDVASSSTSITASGNYFSNSPIYIGARGGSSLYFSGRLYSLIVRGATSDATSTQISRTEAWVNSKTAAY